MKSKKTLLLSFAALSALATFARAENVEVVHQPSVNSNPSSVIGGTGPGTSAKDAKINALESRVAELEALARAYTAKIAAIEKQIYPSARITSPKRRGPNSRR